MLIAVVALSYLTFQNINGFLAAIFGGSITLSGTLLMAWRIIRAADVAFTEKQQGYIEIYIGVLQKFFLTLLMMAVGMGYLKLDPIALLVGFAVTQLSFLANKVDTTLYSN
jgi:ATP synthase protein I